MTEEERWSKVRSIVREENERLEQRLLAALGKVKNKVEFVNGQWIGITDQLRQAWSLAYPAVDIEAELLKAAAWIVSNPTMAPRSQFSRFLLTWFSRTQDRSAIRSIPTRSEMKQTPSLCAYCLAPARGSVQGYRHCGERSCFDKAMGGETPPKMPGVTAKQVAGA